MTEQDPFAQMFASWARLWAKASETAGARDGPFNLAMRAFDPRRWLGMAWPSVEEPMDFLGRLPHFAFPMLDRKLLALAGGWLLLMQRNGEHTLKIMQAWAEAYNDLYGDLNAAAAKGEPVHAGRELLERMLAVFNRKMQEAQRSDDFLASQRKLLEAFLLSRVREREVIEIVASAFDLPTRSEMDDSHRSMHDLKREVRALRRELDRLAPKVRPASGQGPARLIAERSESGRRSQGSGS
jgi:polyhydroxyalkanoate synthase subunit PhaE